MKFRYKAKRPTNTVGIICREEGEIITETRPHIIKQLQRSPLFEEIKDTSTKKSVKAEKKEAKPEETK